ncbi:MAG TPA: DUF5615 family PIN-like protein [Candidatus Kapabacteria bacterium]|nr:DUF5615 family PIN-like protein [Candidatus Kapabacteria bacterium]
MILIADENIGPATIKELRDDGHSVLSIFEHLRGTKDPRVLAEAMGAEGLLITQDKDFGELVFLQHQRTAGVLLLRIHELSYQERSRRVCSTIQAEGERLLGQFSVLTPAGLRSREI